MGLRRLHTAGVVSTQEKDDGGRAKEGAKARRKPLGLKAVPNRGGRWICRRRGVCCIPQEPEAGRNGGPKVYTCVPEGLGGEHTTIKEDNSE